MNDFARGLIAGHHPLTENVDQAVYPRFACAPKISIELWHADPALIQTLFALELGRHARDSRRSVLRNRRRRRSPAGVLATGNRLHTRPRRPHVEDKGSGDGSSGQKTTSGS